MVTVDREGEAVKSRKPAPKFTRRRGPLARCANALMEVAIAKGMSPAQARGAVLRALGGRS